MIDKVAVILVPNGQLSWKGVRTGHESWSDPFDSRPREKRTFRRKGKRDDNPENWKV
jgi:hypothetical protein